MMNSSSFLAICLTFVLSCSLSAQTLSVADINAQIDEDLSAMNEYEALLNDPDPERAARAMKIMLDSGDIDLVRMAKDYGVRSSDARVRRIAFDGILASNPSVELTLDLSSLTENRDTVGSLAYYNGSMRSDGSGFITFRVGAYDSERGCYLNAQSSDCLVQITDTSLSLYFAGGSTWSELIRGSDGGLEGTFALPYLSVSVPMAVQLSK